jgi:hypothetical protein
MTNGRVRLQHWMFGCDWMVVAVQNSDVYPNGTKQKDIDSGNALPTQRNTEIMKRCRICGGISVQEVHGYWTIEQLRTTTEISELEKLFAMKAG